MARPNRPLSPLPEVGESAQDLEYIDLIQNRLIVLDAIVKELPEACRQQDLWVSLRKKPTEEKQLTPYIYMQNITMSAKADFEDLAALALEDKQYILEEVTKLIFSDLKSVFRRVRAMPDEVETALRNAKVGSEEIPILEFAEKSDPEFYKILLSNITNPRTHCSSATKSSLVERSLENCPD